MKSATSQIYEWVEITKYLAEAPDTIFRNFRTLPIFQRVIEGTSIAGGAHLLLRLKRDSFFIDALDLIERSEIFVPPRILKGHVNGKIFNISPTTARYCNNTINLLNLFGLNALGGNIVDIGGGYGGECKIIYDFGVVIGAPPKSYL
ncbi:MAG: hypothetical protein KJ882_00880, partial [Proteobacteria bacterium]|nr:hypothetical protein [Pseudomonadota bacterium]